MGARSPSSILRLSDRLFHALDPIYTGAPGQLERVHGRTIEVGIGGSGSYPDGPSIGKVARIHQDGLGRVPQRKIIVRPDTATRRGMIKDTELELLKRG